MARRRKSKKRSLPRGARGSSKSPKLRHDLDVPLPAAARSTDGRRRAAADRRCLLDRLRATGYGTVAFSHTVYGRPHPEKDAARTVMPWTFEDESEPGTGGAEAGDKGGDGRGGAGGPRVLRRLNVVLEEASDVVRYSAAAAEGPDDDVLNSYDLVAISARSDPAFAAACSNAAAADVFVLDYAAGRGGVQLPHRVRAADVRAAARRGAAFEVPYAPAILDPAKRKALVRTARELRNACAGAGDPRPRVVLSSGTRTTPDGADAGPMALRTPGDLANVMRVVMGFEDRVAFDAMGEAALRAVERGRGRRTGRILSSSAGSGGVAASVVVTEEDGTDAGLRWAADEEAPLAGSMAESLKKRSEEEPRKKAARGESDKDAKCGKAPKDDGRWEIPTDEEQEKIGHEDGFMAL